MSRVRLLVGFIATFVAAMIVGTQLVAAAPTKQNDVNGVVVQGGIHAIIVVDGFGVNGGPGDAKLSMSFHGLEASKNHQLVASVRPCSQTNAEQQPIFGVVVQGGITDPFMQVTLTGKSQQLPLVKSFRLYRFGSGTSTGTKVPLACAKATVWTL